MHKTTVHPDSDRTLYDGKFIQVIQRFFQVSGGAMRRYEITRRKTYGRVVVIAAVTEKGELLLESHFRVPVNCRVIELPAGLMDKEGESEVQAARRELLEETGYCADTLIPLMWGPTTAGLTDEEVIVFYAPGVTKSDETNRDDVEDIEVIHVPLNAVSEYLNQATREGVKVDIKMYAALWKLQELKQVKRGI